MPEPPKTTPAPTNNPFLLAMSPAIQPVTKDSNDIQNSSSSNEPFTIPDLRLEIRDLSSPGSRIFLKSVNAHDVLAKGCRQVLRLLYHSPSCPSTTLPTTRSVTLILRDMPGVAYTKGSDLDNDHKEIHLSTQYIAGIRPETRQKDEICGVLTHELVHCLQYNGRGHCPGGLIEGIADWVRLRCDLSPPHWKREAGDKWDAGYQTTAYFLDWLEDRFGDGTMRRLNEYMREAKYEQRIIWMVLVGKDVEDLWLEYADELKKGK